MREFIGASTIINMLGGKKKRNSMANTMLGLIGTAAGIGAVTYMVSRNKMSKNISKNQ